MAVLIPNMKLPKNCWECPCFRQDTAPGNPDTYGFQCNITLDSFVETPEVTVKLMRGEIENPIEKLIYRHCPLKEVRYGLEG